MLKTPLKFIKLAPRQSVIILAGSALAGLIQSLTVFSLVPLSDILGLPVAEDNGFVSVFRLILDIANLEYLTAIYNFQGILSDESGNSNNGTGTSITYGTDKWNGKSATFNGTTSRVAVPDSTSLAFAGELDIFIWAKWTATTTGMYLLSKRIEGDVFQDNVYQTNVFSTSTDLGIGIQVNAATAGDVRVSLGSTSITSSSAGFNDGEWHLIRVVRDSANLVTLYVDNASKGTATITGTTVTSQPLYIGSDFSGGYFNGSIARVRLYKDGNVLKADIYQGLQERSLNDAAKNAILNSKWKPALNKGEPVGVWIVVPIEFKISQEFY